MLRVLVLFVVLVLSAPGYGNDRRDHLINGPADRRVDIVVLGDGFREAEREAFFSAAADIAESLLGESPFSDYRGHFNVRLLFTASNESGADDPSENVFRDTAFGARFDCFDIARLLCIDSGPVSRELGERLEAGEHDIVLVIVNDGQYGGSGGAYTTASLHPLASEVAIHEIGHSFARLADEYEASQAICDFYNLGANAPNIEDNTVRAMIKWNVGGGPPTGWIDAARPLPSTDQDRSRPGAYDGAALCPRGAGLYRPTFNSKMRSLNQPFDQINSEQLVLRIYQDSGVLVNDGSDAASVFAVTPQELPFALPVIGNPALLRFLWLQGNEEVSTNGALQEEDLSPGVTELDYLVEDNSGYLRQDENGDSRAQRRVFLAFADTRESEPNDSTGNASPLASDVSVAGTLLAAEGDTADYFLFEAGGEAPVQMHGAALTPDGSDVSLLIQGTDGVWSQDIALRTADPVIVLDETLPAGTYSAKVYAATPAAYTLKLILQEPPSAPGTPRARIHDLDRGKIVLYVEPAEGEDSEGVLFLARCASAEQVFEVEGPGPLLQFTGLDEVASYQCSVKAMNDIGTSADFEFVRALQPVETIETGMPLWLLIELVYGESLRAQKEE